MEHRIVFTGKNELKLESFEPNVCGEGQVVARTLSSLISTGTEGIVLNRLFAAGSHWDDWVKYPFYAGYAVVARVEQIGAGVKSLHIGDRVVCRHGHSSVIVVGEFDCDKVPDGITDEDAAWFALAKIAFMSARAAKYFLGESVVIIGGGPIGQMAVRWANAAGLANIVVVDPVSRRLELAKLGGATTVIDKPIDQARDAIIGALGGQEPQILIDSTGNAKVFSSILKMAGTCARVIILGDTGTPDNQHLTGDLVSKGLQVIGASDGLVWPAPHIHQLYFTLLKKGMISMKGMNTHSFAPAEARAAYDVINTRRQETMGVLFHWKKA